MKASVALIALVAILGTSGSAQADPATAKVPSDFTGKEIDVSTNTIDTKPRELRVSVGGYFGSGSGNQGYQLRGSYTDPHYAGVVEKEFAFGVAFDPAVKSQVKYNPFTRQAQGVDLSAGELGARIQITPREKDAAMPYLTGQATMFPFRGVYRDDPLLAKRQYGVEFAIADFTGHASYKVGTLPVDICGFVNLATAVYGYNKLAEVEKKKGMAWKIIDMGVCAGVGLGEKVGKLHAQVGMDYGMFANEDTAKIQIAKSLNWRAGLGVERLGGSGLGLNYNHSVGNTISDDGSERVYKEHLFNVQYAF